MAAVAACSGSDHSGVVGSTALTPSSTVTVAAGAEPTTTAATSTTTSTLRASTLPTTSTVPLPPVPATTASPSPPDNSGATPYGLPVADGAGASWADTHATYPATDIFVGCGARVVAPVNGVLTEVRRVNAYDPAVDNPATRGGRSVTMIGDDGVRYYFAHFEQIADGLAPGSRVAIGQELGAMGETGRASACHLHLGISPPCPGKEWSVRRGVVWPYPYLDAWRAGTQLSPVEEVLRWLAEHPDACAEAMADPNAADA